MARGVLSGAIWGAVISIGGLSAASLIAPPPPEERFAALAPALDATAEPETQGPADPPDSEPTEIAPADPAPEAEPQPEVESEPAGAPSEPAPSTREPGSAPAPGAAVSDPAAAPQPTPDPAVEPAQDAAREARALETQTQEAAPAADPSKPARRPTDVTTVTPDAASPALSTPEGVADRAPQDLNTAPTAAPQIGAPEVALQSPQVAAQQDAPTLAQDAPRADRRALAGLDSPTLNAPDLKAPVIERDLAIATEPAQPPAPPVPGETSPLETPEEVGAASRETAPNASSSEAETSPDAPFAQNDGDTAPEPRIRRLEPTPPAQDGAGDTTSGEGDPALIGRPAGSFADRGNGVSSRLPSIGGGTDETVGARTPAADSRPALERFAAPAETASGLPRMAIVLIDDGTGPLGPDTLDNFPFPVTFALDPGQPGAADRMEAYRAQGYEVAALVDLPQAAAPADVEQILAGSVAAVPEAVALIEAPGGGLQTARAATEQATRFAAESGHGLVFMSNGLNTAEAMARREEVPTISVLRDFDGGDQDARTKRRFLDGAAFRARQDGAVAMLGRYTPDTVSALLLWSLQDRASSVAIVPVSNLLMEQPD
ncbi:divergent polysaccharide deacteylase family protein [Marivita sp. GX14005]|uniref:divergent polysaccharide deacteylase family protein n=1 Tax=Marivita sp. GX14005 TaxID=2942276 RepID=UPI002018DE5E|nr:divergent polysaccharide deacteylase family protein [Marivita sp. GX14005]MCL3883455.1 divergent polysaccharide deacetylase family protein [Marivita sp. GX14005]